MTTVAYCAVAPDGRTAPDQIQWTDEAMPGLRVLTDAVHAEGAAVSAQIGHAGPVADPRGNKRPGALAEHPVPEHVLAASRARRSAPTSSGSRPPTPRPRRRAIEAGFDAVEVHLGHSYLPSAFLSPKINHRKDEFGGSLENRARFARGILRAVRDAVGDRIAILTKLNMSDGVRGGITVEEAIQTARWIEQDGTVDAFEMTGGSSLLNPMYLFRGGAPVKEFVEVMPQPIKTVMRVSAAQFIREYPYRGRLPARRRRAGSAPSRAADGAARRHHRPAASMDLAMQEGFEFVAMGRALLREPDLVNRIAADAGTPSLCIHCNRCMPTNFVGTHCPVVHEGSSRSATWGTPAGYA